MMLLIEHINNLLVEQGEQVAVPTQRVCQKLYNEYNAMYFGNQLPSNLRIEVSARMDKAWGLASCVFRMGNVIPTSIKICSRRAITDFALRSTMLHEMVHILDYATHPEHFIKETYRGFVKVRGYDAHGNWFMTNPISQKIRQDGFVIERYVQDSQKMDAELSDTMKAKAQKIVGNGVYAILGKFGGKFAGKTYFRKISLADFELYKKKEALFQNEFNCWKRSGAIEFLLVKTTNQDIALSRATQSMKPVNIDIDSECEVVFDLK